MAETKDARKLSSGTKEEEAYANYANHMKALGNAALTALLVWLSQFTTGCTAVVVPSDDSTAPTVTVTGALPVGVQFNSMTEKPKGKNNNEY